MNGFRVYKCTDKVEIKIDNISIFISPLTYLQKSNLQPLMVSAATGNMDDAMKAVVQAMKYALKGIKGVTTINDEGEEVPYKVELENGEATEDCVNDILNMPISQKVSTICTGLMSGLSSRICDPTGKPIEGIEVVGKVVEKK